MTPPNTSFAPFKTARRFAQSLKLTTRDEWRAWAAGKDNHARLRARGIPLNPEYAYRNDGWNGWSDWLGANVFRPKPFLTYAKWRTWLLQCRFSRARDPFLLGFSRAFPP
jgi:hypothetical protein